jgi:hypothetical protein
MPVQFYPQSEGVIIWPSFGSGGSTPGATGTRRRDFKRFQILDTGFEGVIVWNSVGGGGTTPTPTVVVNVNVGAGVDVPSWEEAVQQRFNELHGQLATVLKQDKQLARKITATKKKLEKAEKPEGILVNLHLLDQKRQELRREIKDLRLQIEWAALEFEEEEDEELQLLH